MTEFLADLPIFEIAKAVGTFVASAVLGWLSGRRAAALQKEKLEHAFALQRERLRAELKLEYSVEAAIREMLSDKRFPERKRSFPAIKRRLAGFGDDELRKHLVRAGAVSFRQRGVAGDDGELWGLRELVDKDGLWEAA